MRKLILGLITAISVNISFGQKTERMDYCKCKDQIEETIPDLNGRFVRECNGILLEEGEFVDGHKNGEWLSYNRTGKMIRKLSYEKGLLNGKVELFYTNGKPKLTGQFEMGKKVGKWTYYTKKGKILSAGSFENNIPIGIWTINDKKGKRSVVQYDYNSKRYLINKSTPSHKDRDIIQNENTEEWYIVWSPDLKFSSKSEPLGGFEFANYLFVELVEVPVNYWDTYLYQKYKIKYNITAENELSFESEFFEGDQPDDSLELTFLIMTNPTSKIKQIDHSDLQIKLLGYKIKEALSLMGPWVYNGQSDIDVYLHYVINKNMHRK